MTISFHLVYLQKRICACYFYYFLFLLFFLINIVKMSALYNPLYVSIFFQILLSVRWILFLLSPYPPPKFSHSL